jgi:hypothetical protein
MNNILPIGIAPFFNTAITLPSLILCVGIV